MPKKSEPTASTQIGAQLLTERKKQSELESQTTAIAETLASLKADYERAVQNGESDGQLDQREEAIIRGERELARAQIKLSQCKAEIENLEQQRTEALKAETEAEFEKTFDDLCDRFLAFEMAFTDFQGRKAEIEEAIRNFTNRAADSGRDVHRLRIGDQIRRQVIERLWPGYQSKHNPEAYKAPMADVLESHCRSALGIQRPANGKATETEAEQTANP